MGIDYNHDIIRLYSFVSLLLVAPLAVMAMREDMRHRRIPNKLLLAFLAAGLGMHAVLLAAGVALHAPSAVRYAGYSLLNAGIALIAGYAFFALELWAPGDGKLFFTAALLVPLQAYNRQYVPVFPALVFLVNIYLVSFLIILALSVIAFMRRLFDLEGAGALSLDSIRSSTQTFKSRFNLMALFRFAILAIVNFMAIMLLMDILQDSLWKFFHFRSRGVSMVAMAALYFVMQKFRDNMRSAKALMISAAIFCTLAGFHVIVLKEPVGRVMPGAFYTALIMILALPAAIWIIQLRGAAAHETTVGDIQPGACLSEESAREVDQKTGAGVAAGVPLSSEQYQAIRDGFPDSHGLHTASYMTFSPYIFIALLYTLAYRATILHAVFSATR